MRIYLCARFGRREQLKPLAEELRRLGHVVTSRWLDTDCPASDTGPTAAPSDQRVEHGRRDIEDVVAADCVVCFTEDPYQPPVSSRGGRHVEFGYALALGKRVIVVGHRENLFCFLPEIEFFNSQWDFVRHLEQTQESR